MELRLRDSASIIDESFAVWLRSHIKVKLISSINKYKLVNWDKYLNESENVSRLYKDKKYKASEIIMFAASKLVCTSVRGEVVISFKKNTFVPGFDRLDLNNIIKTINYGTVDIKGCPIFSDVLNNFAKNIDTYASMYYNL